MQWRSITQSFAVAVMLAASSCSSSGA
ncbi:MAG: hypothetical protein RJA49_1356, partial [Actinomycetota bacterium]